MSPEYRFISGHDDSSEWTLGREKYETVDAAVQAAINESSGTPFLIVRVVKWTANEGEPEET